MLKTFTFLALAAPTAAVLNLGRALNTADDIVGGLEQLRENINLGALQSANVNEGFGLFLEIMLTKYFFCCAGRKWLSFQLVSRKKCMVLVELNGML